MALPTVNGILDDVLEAVVPTSTYTWADFNTDSVTWDNWVEWDRQPADPLVWEANPLDLGENLFFTLEIETVANGDVSYKIYTSTTGAFAGEETETVIANGATSVSGFYGRYVLVYVEVARTSGLNVLYGVDVTAKTLTVQEKQGDVDTSTLSGTVNARTVSLTRSFSKITNILVTPHEETAYTLDVYVTDTTTSTYLIPKIISKTLSGPEIALIGVDNQPRDGVVDITITGLPFMSMDGNNLVISA
jgi:hypothetical protein